MAGLINERRARCMRLMRLMLALTAVGAGGHCVAQDCRFQSAGSSLSFPPLDPLVASTATAVSSVQLRCTPTSVSPTWSFSGANGSAPLRMKHATTANYIPYTVASAFLSSSGSTESWRLTGTVLGANYQDAQPGTYSDILTATILP